MKARSITLFAATLATAVLLCAAPSVMAETSKKSDKVTAAKPAVVTKADKPVNKSAADKTALQKTAKPEKPEKSGNSASGKKPAASASRTDIKSTAANVAAGIEAAEAAMTPAELAIADRVQVGKLPCELGASVTLTADPKNAGYFDMQGKNFNYRMFPVATSTGAIRLEDQKAGAVWLQLANKSMLMNQKLGIRLADECTSPAQLEVAQNLKLNPPVSILEPLPPAVAK